ncbi:MAG TPA: phosphoribosyltransferase family protein [Gammaproteobacteria bacterium]|nr:phosphoribosyltransferase family protein [Gammaproteobacteria bacterium]
MPFSNRTEAGRRIAQALVHYRELHPVVLALPRGGVPVAAEVARALEAPLDLIIVRKIGVPFQPELAMGAVVDGPEPLVVRNDDIIRLARVSEADFARVRDRELAEIQRRRDRYLANRPHTDLKDRVVIGVDDGIATGATTRAALRAVRAQQPAHLILAVPVAPTDVLRNLQDEADEIVYLEAHEDFGAIGFYYADFRQIADDEVTAILAELAEAARRREAVAAV